MEEYRNHNNNKELSLIFQLERDEIELAKLRKDNILLINKNDILTEELDFEMGKIKSLKEAINYEKKWNQKLNYENSKIKDEIKKIKSHNSDIVNNFNSLKRERDQRETILTNLKNENEKLRRELSNLETSFLMETGFSDKELTSQIKILNTNIKTLKKRCLELERLNKEATAHSKENNKLKKEQKDLEENLSESWGEILDLKKQLSYSEEQAKKNEKALENKINCLETKLVEMKKLENECKSLNLKLKEAVKKQEKTELEKKKLEEQLIDLKGEQTASKAKVVNKRKIRSLSDQIIDRERQTYQEEMIIRGPRGYNSPWNK